MRNATVFTKTKYTNEGFVNHQKLIRWILPRFRSIIKAGRTTTIYMLQKGIQVDEIYRITRNTIYVCATSH